MMTQGERIKEIRKVLNLTLEKFGTQVGVGKSAISKLEKGDCNLSDQMAKAICREFNVNHDYLINGEGDMFSNLPETVLDELCIQYECDEYDKQLIKLYLELPFDVRKLLKEKIKDIFNQNALTDISDKTYKTPFNTKSKSFPKQEQDNFTIDEMVEDYRRQLEAEEKATAKSSALQKNA